MHLPSGMNAKQTQQTPAISRETHRERRLPNLSEKNGVTA